MKLSHLSAKQWYWQIENSGDLYTTHDFKTLKFVSANVTKSSFCTDDGIFYLTVFGVLYYLDTVLKYDDEAYNDWFLNQEETTLISHKTYKILDQVRDYQFYTGHLICLTTQDEVHLVSPDEKMVIVTNIKTLFSYSSIPDKCLFLSNTNDLYVCNFKEQYNLIKVASDVKYAFIDATDNKWFVIYYLTTNGNLWMIYPKLKYRLQTLEQILSHPTFLEPEVSNQCFKLSVGNYKYVTCTSHYLFVIDNCHKLFIFRKDCICPNEVFRTIEKRDKFPFCQLHPNLSHLNFKTVISSYPHVYLLDTQQNVYQLHVHDVGCNMYLSPEVEASHILNICPGDPILLIVSRNDGPKFYSICESLNEDHYDCDDYDSDD